MGGEGEFEEGGKGGGGGVIVMFVVIEIMIYDYSFNL